MLVIRKEQIQQLIAPDELSLVRLIRNLIREGNPERVKGYSDQLLDWMIRIGILRAESRGLSLAEDVAAFVAVMFEIAPNFDEHTEIDKALNGDSFPVAERFRQLFEHVSEEAWGEAEQNYNSKVWFPEK